MELQPSALWANDPDAISDERESIDHDDDEFQQASEDPVMRLETIAGLQAQLEALHDDLEGLVQSRKRQDEQIHMLQRQLSETEKSNDERTRQIEFLEIQNRDCEQAHQRLMASLGNVERELAKVNAQVCAMQDYVNQAFESIQSSEVRRLIHALLEQLDKQVSLNKYLSEEIKQMVDNNQRPSSCHRYEELTLRPLGVANDTCSQQRLLPRVWLATFYFLFCFWCGVFTPVISSSQATSFWLQFAETINIAPT
ncbi:hypothetical protein BG006_002371 [Podila minutissima]|uniref:Uncharacterized protein n=1 Tax=Podila minutissima TaxID=64525 RepID=A0A9P5SRG1_9FUNG|nr:hypothetical protein BG006_002371 [Podila minutissima]